MRIVALRLSADHNDDSRSHSRTKFYPFFVIPKADIEAARSSVGTL